MWTALLICVAALPAMWLTSFISYGGAKVAKGENDPAAAKVLEGIGCGFGTLFLLDVLAILTLLTWTLATLINGA